MPIATPKQYAAMIDAAQKGNYAFAAINITSISTINGALDAFSELKADGIIQVSSGAGEFAGGQRLKDSVLGSIVLAEAIHTLAAKHNVLIALHTDHCQPGVKDTYMKNWLKAEAKRLGVEIAADGTLPEAIFKAHPWLINKKEPGKVAKELAGGKVDGWLKPLIKETARRRAAGLPNLFQSHMLDASNLPLALNMELSQELLKECAPNEIILEVEAGVVGGKEEGMDNTEVDHSKLYTSPKDMVAVYEALNGLGRYMFAATFGNVHGHYKPGAVKLQPQILRDGQKAVVDKFGKQAAFDLVFHGGSGTPSHEIHETLEYGVIKMNIDTDTQYAFTRPIVDHCMKNYDKVLKIDGEIGEKDAYDPRAYLKLGEKGVTKRMCEAITDLKSNGKSLCGQV